MSVPVNSARWLPATLLAAVLTAGPGLVHADDELQRRPGRDRPEPEMPKQPDPNRASGIERIEPIRPPDDAVGRSVPVPDRWRIVDTLGIVEQNWWDPYSQNVYKADKPLHDDWFLDVSLTSDTIYEPRRFPVPVSPQATTRSGELDLIGDGRQQVFAETLIAGLVYYKGDTVFRPPDYEYRLTLAGQYNRVETEQARLLRADPGEGTDRTDHHLGVQEAFVDIHLRDVSPRYDFDSVRFGIQPFNADFRGFLFQDEQFGARLFGTRDNNIFQYNLAWFRRIEKDTNSGLNDIEEGLRADDVFAANLYWQDFPVLGFFTQATVVHNRNREGDEGPHYNTNDFIERPASIGLEKPRNYDVTYLGLSGDGHFGRLNFTGSMYYAFGEQDRGVFLDQPTDIRAGFAAGEFSMDFDWMRVRLSGLYASGDDDPFDDVSTGFDSIFENPLFAGADTSFWIRQPVPLIGGGRVTLSGRNGILNSLRSSKEEGQSNFDNPGTMLVGVGTDHDLTPQWRVSTNINQLWFDETATLEVARQQADIDPEIGTDISIASIYRPLFSQNIIFRASAATLVPGDGYSQLFDDDKDPYSVLFNLILTY
ncbi:hypothetical protein [Halofilum ochraceum]|uniref:hypothetical protein n=1 Tax=Halofilum ochraceum TaxID=1611323 RepID=UPI00111313C3|nr:hypothetical protein [Halofilum ochraceum]